MDIMEAMRLRHSVRRYENKAIEGEVLDELKKEIDECNSESGLNFQLVLNEPKAFSGAMARYGKFSGVSNYIALVGKKSKDLDRLCGYYGEKLVLKIQQLGLGSCWVALTYKKVPEAFTVRNGEKLTVVISVGYAKARGVPHKSKDISKVSDVTDSSPSWYKQGVEAALLAPTAMNQQKFKFRLDGEKVTASAGVGFYAKMDLGIAQYHFEVATGKKVEIK
ncbi:MAG: nitroreductase [Clostridiales bacterium]|nr:nitroreductase [Clostridiales bacterium]